MSKTKKEETTNEDQNPLETVVEITKNHADTSNGVEKSPELKTEIEKNTPYKISTIYTLKNQDIILSNLLKK